MTKCIKEKTGLQKLKNQIAWIAVCNRILSLLHNCLFSITICTFLSRCFCTCAAMYSTVTRVSLVLFQCKCYSWLWSLAWFLTLYYEVVHFSCKFVVLRHSLKIKDKLILIKTNSKNLYTLELSNFLHWYSALSDVNKIDLSTKMIFISISITVYFFKTQNNKDLDLETTISNLKLSVCKLKRNINF